MDSQGAGFAFDATNMDFFTGAQPVFNKPEDSTSSFIFGDEGIDAGFSFDNMSPALLSTTQMNFDMQQPLVGVHAWIMGMCNADTDAAQAMDNTSGSASDWNQHLTPLLHNGLNTFPSTPTHSFNSMYQQNTTLGKRTRESQDFPQAKRLHEAAHDFTLFPSLDTTSSWTLDAQPTPPSSIDFGLPDEAAEVCAMWFNKYNVLPSDKHIDSLSQLTGESTDAIRSWFGRLLKQGMGGSQGDSAYKSQTGLIPQQDSFWDNTFSNDTLQASPIDLLAQQPEITATPQVPCSHEHTTAVLPATALRGSKKRCSPTDDQSLLARDSNKIYQCTRKCGKRYGRKCDWKRNEEEGYPCKSWVCSLCKSDGVENVKPCFRKYHFVQHFRNIHPDLNADEYEEASVVSSDTEFPRQCGFCRHRFTSRQDRIDHIADHFKQGKCMLDWNEEDMSDSDGSDGSDDNNDDDNSDNGGSNGGKPSYPPPQYDPSGDAGSQYYGGGSSGGGSNSGGKPSQSGFFQFQLSQLHEGGGSERESCSEPQSCSEGQNCTKPQSIIEEHTASAQGEIQRVRSLSELGKERHLSEHSSATRSDTGAMAGDDVSVIAVVEDIHGSEAVIADKSIDRDPQSGSSNPGDDGLRWLNNKSSSSVGLAKIISDQLQVSPMPTDLQSVMICEVEATSDLQVVSKNSSKKNSTRTLSQQILQTVPTTSQSFLSIKLLGAGGFSTVDEVVHRDTNLRVGRKTLKNREQTAVEELRKEVNVLQKLRHPHIIRFLGAYSKGDKMSILLSPVAETTLALWLERSAVQKPVNLTETITSMFGCLVSSVRYLHEQRPIVKHLDIKPQNILIVENGKDMPHVVLTDFGVSTSEDSADGQAVPITRQYVAPEVFNGVARKEAADIWSLGCVFAEMASVPFSQDNNGWLAFRKQFSGSQSKNYWQDTIGVQDGLTVCLDAAATVFEQHVVRTIKTMLNALPQERPSAAALTLVFTPAPCCLDWSNDKSAFPGPHEEFDRVEMCVHKDDVDCSIRRPGHSQDGDLVRKQTSVLSSWLDDCLDNHDACRRVAVNRDLKSVPTRLIDLRPSDDSSVVRLVESDTIDSSVDSVRYIALSHTWGQRDALLTSKTLSRMCTGLPTQAVPDAIRKAIGVARDLGYRYIWADTLCVIQDSEADREQECKAMASVFRNAVFTINLDQMLSTTPSTESVSMNAVDNGRNQTSAFATQRPSSAALSSVDFRTPGFGWNTRAWVLQERLLSHRFLHLGEQMYWECNTLKASETFPRGLSPLVWEKVHSSSGTTTHVTKTSTSRPNATKHGLVGSKTADTVRLYTPCKQRDCQWIKKEGDGIGDSMVAAQTTLQLGDVPASSTTATCSSPRAPCSCKPHHFVHDAHQNFPGSTTTNKTALSSAPTHPIVPDDTLSPSMTTVSSSSPTSSVHILEKSGRREICASGQLDQHGRVEWESDVNANRLACDGNGKDMD